MKRTLWLVVLVVLTGIGAFALTRHYIGHSNEDEMTWLRREFALTPAQAAAIDKLHRDYEPVCAEHCRRIAEVQAKLHALKTAGAKSAEERSAAEREWNAIADECTTATRVHLEKVAAEMSPDQGRRYLALVGPKLTQHNSGVPFGLR